MSKIIKDNRNVSQKTAQQYIDKVRALKGKVKEYEGMLEMEITSAQATMEIALQQAMKLLENVNAA